MVTKTNIKIVTVSFNTLAYCYNEICSNKIPDTPFCIKNLIRFMLNYGSYDHICKHLRMTFKTYADKNRVMKLYTIYSYAQQSIFSLGVIS